MKTFFSFSRRDRNGLVLFLLLIFAVITFAHFYVKRSLVNQRHQQTFILESVQMVKDLENQGINSAPQKAPMQTPEASVVVKNEKTCAHKEAFVDSAESLADTLLIELNSADSVSLLALPAIGPVDAGRIVKYRQMLGGYHDTEQLLEVYGFDNERLERILPLLELDTSFITTININSASFKSVLYHPYIDYDLTKRIFNAKRRQPYSGMNDFIQRTKISEDTARKIAPYISF